MDQQQFLTKLASLTEELELKGFYKEADILHQNFIKLAEEDEIVELSVEEAVDLGMLPPSALRENNPKRVEQFSVPKSLVKTPNLLRLFQKNKANIPAVTSLGSSQLESIIGADVYRGLSRESLDKLTSRMLSGRFTDEQLKNIASKQFQKEFGRFKFKAGLKDIGKFGLVDSLLNMGVNYAVDFFEDAQGPYNLFKNHLPDVKKIINKINSLVNDNETMQLGQELLKFLDDCMNELEKAKTTIKTAHNINFKTVYNNKNTKLAIRGELESEAPKYLRDLVQGGLIGAGTGALFGGVGALPGAILGAGSKLLGRAAEDIWYANISDTGKAYLQSKDLEEKISRLANSFNEINPELSQEINNLADKIMARVEKLNIENPNKTYLENVIRHFEKKVEKVTKPLSDVAKGAAGLVEKGVDQAKTVKVRIPNQVQSPTIERDYFIK